MSFEIMFWFLSLMVAVGGLMVLVMPNPIHSALSLVLSMLGVAGHFFLLDAHFLGAVQIVVYAGAVMVLFVMVIMLFNLEDEHHAFSSGKLSGFLKLAIAGTLLGLLAGAITLSLDATLSTPVTDTNGAETSKLATLLFTKYLFQFEVMGILLLVVAVGAVALARSKGGTHGQHDHN